MSEQLQVNMGLERIAFDPDFVVGYQAGLRVCSNCYGRLLRAIFACAGWYSLSNSLYLWSWLGSTSPFHKEVACVVAHYIPCPNFSIADDAYTLVDCQEMGIDGRQIRSDGSVYIRLRRQPPQQRHLEDKVTE
jgi:hypothetical protein